MFISKKKLDQVAKEKAKFDKNNMVLRVAGLFELYRAATQDLRERAKETGDDALNTIKKLDEAYTAATVDLLYLIDGEAAMSQFEKDRDEIRAKAASVGEEKRGEKHADA